MAKSFNSISDKKAPNLAASFRSLRYIPRLFAEVHKVHPRLFWYTIGGRLAGALLPVAILWVGKLIIDEIVRQAASPSPNYTPIWQYVALELGLAIASDMLSRWVNLTDGLLGDLYANASSVHIIRKTNDIEISQLEDPVFYDKLEKARMQTNGRVNLLSATLGEAQNLISIVSLIAGLIYFEPWLLVLLVLSIIPAFINEIKFSGRRYSLVNSWTAERRELDYLRFIGANDKTAKEIKLFGLTHFIANRFASLSHQYYLLHKKLSIQRAWYGALFNLLGVLCYYGAYVLIVYRVVAGVITLGELTFLSAAFNRLRNNLQGFFGAFTRITESALYLKDYFDFIDYKLPLTLQEDIPIPKTITHGFEIVDLHFAYPGSDLAVLSGVSFTLKAGEKMAFVGQNGAGKTTLIKLLLRFYEPTGGHILLDGIPIQRFNKQAYQQMFGVIFQDFFRYEFTVKENIAVGNIDEIGNQALLQEAADRSLATEVVQSLPLGYQQQLGKRFVKGMELSGGQWQKIALARAYMKDAPVLILDEPTSALDARAEAEVFERFIGLTRGKTSIIISHRFSTVRMADRILVL
ncbi:MAG TPA: ABC transporter ATP-binding protein, partial [Phnomibacter sp.]|nr:ABC transporter ATP-binding protein [Phnomibacter sp.]